ncbi:class I SAM-dependent methyltransferase [Jiangella aurantiaca]|uniref:Class I SAM-dependent methyltransferase n=1 Tax=Jiangella aurantiaca TaxID=2530373 RepID=A0A4R5A1T2_9ACTN|nr:class I SAM-dependent methyltransferase [Jiangella aurantiaca]TDD64594.1 class I SAM-dependent methyltransferase [Jiangella aurantiaca]
MYTDDDVAALYEVLNPWGPGDDFYLERVMAAGSVLDVGCGPGGLLRRARDEGHTGRLCGLDPDHAALTRARRRSDVEWVEGRAADLTAAGEFELAVMTGNAFQELVGDDDLTASLAAIRRALAGGGRFAFETRNPGTREWESWRPENGTDVVDDSGRELRVWHHVEAVVDGLVTLTETTGTRDGTPLRVDRATLRFTAAGTLDALLTAAGFTVEERYGWWDRRPFAPDSRLIITVARASDG